MTVVDWGGRPHSTTVMFAAPKFRNSILMYTNKLRPGQTDKWTEELTDPFT